jgi:uncharacterized protein YwbE
MLDPTLKKNVTIGSLVVIDTNNDPGVADLVKGIVETVITHESYRAQGIEVELSTGEQGSVEEIINFVESKRDPDLELIKGKENSIVEFKKSFTFDHNRFDTTGEKARNEKLEFYLPKSIAGFANHFGGTVFFGVDDDANIVGMSEDLEIMNLDEDRFEQRMLALTNKLFEHNEAISNRVKMSFLHFPEGNVFKIYVTPSKKPFIFSTTYTLKNEKGKEEVVTLPHFFVRQGNVTEPFTPQRFVNYWMEHLKEL